MRSEPSTRRAFAFFDGQNLFYAAREAFGYSYPNYDPRRLANTVCASKGWSVAGIQFYTGVPAAADKPFWNRFWTMKLSTMGRQGVRTFSRPLRYRNQTVTLRDGTTTVTLVGQEKVSTFASPWTSCGSPSKTSMTSRSSSAGTRI